MGKTADKDTWVDDPTRPGVEVLVRAGEELPEAPAPQEGLKVVAKEKDDPDRPGVKVVQGDDVDAKAVSAPAENKAQKAPAKKKG